jgi:hypothetical protein
MGIQIKGRSKRVTKLRQMTKSDPEERRRKEKTIRGQGRGK